MSVSLAEGAEILKTAYINKHPEPILVLDAPLTEPREATELEQKILFACTATLGLVEEDLLHATSQSKYDFFHTEEGQEYLLLRFPNYPTRQDIANTYDFLTNPNRVRQTLWEAPLSQLIRQEAVALLGSKYPAE